MASKGKQTSAADGARRGVTRTVVNALVLLASLGVLVAWGAEGVYTLQPGESAVILRLGAYDRTLVEEGLILHWPPPLESREILRSGELRTESFGSRPTRSTPGQPEDAGEIEISDRIRRDAVQTADNNIVNVAYELQYTVGDAYAYRFAMADPGSILHDATEASMRSVIGRKDINAVLSQDIGEIVVETEQVLEQTLDGYFAQIGHNSAYSINRINLDKPKEPEAVREAFDDVVSADQDRKRSTLQAEGDALEILERARSEAAELRAQAEAYKQARVIESAGEATRFQALLAEYEIAPEVTRKRLYLETMEEILPGVDKMVVEPNTVNMLPMLPLGGQPSAVGAAR
ncbi:MAG: FtsH protease activity modulator HflK [Deltaproteobacteria bacterium]|nr:FtsH protease activity modulator HflK [Deltaproteobacteria bacterium]